MYPPCRSPVTTLCQLQLQCGGRLPSAVHSYIYNKKQLKNVGPIRHCEPPHAALPFTRCRYCRTPPAHRCPQQQRRQRRRVTEGTVVAPWNGPNESDELASAPDDADGRRWRERRHAARHLRRTRPCTCRSRCQSPTQKRLHPCSH